MLAATVSAYINSGVPVSSRDLAQSFGLSSATIRSILGELEDEGYLYHPHTSAGRIPTDKGYRYYVDFLMSQMELSGDQRHNILEEYKKACLSVEDILEKTSEILARLTHYTAIVSFSEWQNKLIYTGLSNILKQREFHDVNKIDQLIELLEEKQQLMGILNQQFKGPWKIFIGEEMSCPVIQDSCSLIISSYHSAKKGDGKIAVLGPRRMSYDQTISAVESVSSILNTILEEL